MVSVWITTKRSGGEMGERSTWRDDLPGQGRVRPVIVVSSSITGDITERKRAEIALRDAEDRFRRAFEEAPIGMAMLDLTAASWK